MKKKSVAYRPSLGPLENRVLLFSFSGLFSSLIHSIEGTSATTTTVNPVRSAANAHALQLRIQLHEQKVEAARLLRAEHQAAHPHVHAHVK
jgi:hypothetical protein